MPSRKVNKKQLISRVRRYMGPGTTHSTAAAAVEAVLASVSLLSEQGKLRITRFGVFEQQTRGARRVYSIPDGQMEDREPRQRLTFTPARGFPERTAP